MHWWYNYGNIVSMKYNYTDLYLKVLKFCTSVTFMYGGYLKYPADRI